MKDKNKIDISKELFEEIQFKHKEYINDGDMLELRKSGLSHRENEYIRVFHEDNTIRYDMGYIGYSGSLNNQILNLQIFIKSAKLWALKEGCSISTQPTLMNDKTMWLIKYFKNNKYSEPEYFDFEEEGVISVCEKLFEEKLDKNLNLSITIDTKESKVINPFENMTGKQKRIMAGIDYESMRDFKKNTKELNKKGIKSKLPDRQYKKRRKDKKDD